MMIGAFAVFALLDAGAKSLSATLGPSMSVFFRYFLALVLIAMVMLGILLKKLPILMILAFPKLVVSSTQW